MTTAKSNEIRDKIEELIGQHPALYQLLHYFESELEKDRESRWISVKKDESAYKTVSSNTQSCGKFEIKSHYDFEPVESSEPQEKKPDLFYGYLDEGVYGEFRHVPEPSPNKDKIGFIFGGKRYEFSRLAEPDKNKPESQHFEQIASFRSDITDHSMFLGFRSGCEHVWNTHVVPLQEKIAGIDAFVDTCTDEYKREYAKLESENKALREEIERLKVEVLKEKFPEN